jgi:Uma2 family endonuclease
MMTIGPLHERYKTRLDVFISIVANELGIVRQPVGSTTWKRKKLKRAIEPDSSY